jgi:aminoglycoside phosphotransferase (APT) family kinase protein
MTANNPDEIETSVDIVRRLVAAQFPQWGDLSITGLPSAGTDHAIYRLGESMSIRMPRVPWARQQSEKEHQWLPKLAGHLPLAIPKPLAKGLPGEGYPWEWSVYDWCAGENATLDRLVDPHQAAVDLAAFVRALRAIDTTSGPAAGRHNFGRGVPLAQRDAATRSAIAAVEKLYNVKTLTDAWNAALAEPVWESPPVWIHGDLQSGNLLAVAGRLSAVIDFGGLGVGDPACDLMVAWNLFPADVRETYRAAVATDEATWARGRGWALSVALIALPYYLNTNRFMVEMSQYTIAQVLGDL